MLDEVVDGYEPMPEILSVMAASEPANLLALDIGTSGIRAALFDAQGNELPGANIRVPFSSNSLADFGFIDADIVLEEIGQTIDELFATRPEPTGPIELVAISCFWHSLLGIDDSNHPTTPLLGWSDVRAEDAAENLKQQLEESHFHQLTGCRFHSSYWPAKLLRIQQTEPAVFNATRRWLSFSDFLMLRWCEESVTSVSMASGTGLMDQLTCDWNQELLKHLRLDTNTLPLIATSASESGTLKSDSAVRWPQLAGAQILPAIGDGAANNIGAGCTSKETAALMIGTSGAMRVAYEGNPPQTIPPELWSYRVDRERVIVGGALSDGGNIYSWITRAFFRDVDAESLESQIAELEPDAHGITVLPFWNGERSTGWHSRARGTIEGLTLRTRPVEILRAAMEAVAYRFALIARALDTVAPAASIISSGYALRSSPAWVQILADVLGREILVSEVSEASTRGAALLALEATGKIQTHAVFPVSISAIVKPDMTRHARYHQGLERQQRMYEQMFERETPANPSLNRTVK